MSDELHGTGAVEPDDRSYEAPALEVLGSVEELAAANEDSTTIVDSRS